MNSITDRFDVVAEAVSAMAASRGILAPQGIKGSGVDANCRQDRPVVGWLPGYAPAATAGTERIAMPVHLGNTRLRVRPATVYRSRLRCRAR